MDLPTISGIIHLCAVILGYAGAVLIIYGGFRAIVRVVIVECKKTGFTYNQIRREFTDKIVFGLEFLIAADIISTVTIKPNREGILSLGLLIVVRTFLSWSIILEVEGCWPWQVVKKVKD